MPECEMCGEEIEATGAFSCSHCGDTHCSDHRLPENHLCGVKTVSTTDGGSGEGGYDLLSIMSAPFWMLGLLLWGIWAGVVGGLKQIFYSDAPIWVAVVLVGAAAIVVGGGAIGSVSDDGGTSEEEGGLDEQQLEALIHETANDERQERGVSALDRHSGLAADAEDHSEDMARRDFLSHTNPDGEGLAERTDVPCAAAENLALHTIEGAGRPDDLDTEREVAEEVVQWWMGSEGHREALLSSEYESEGIGVHITDEGDVYVTQMFCR